MHVQPHGQCMHSHVISVWWASWSVHGQPRDQCLVRHVISAWSGKWRVNDQPRDQCMIVMLSVHDSYVISVWSNSWSVHDQTRDQCMISHVICAWSVTWSVHAVKTWAGQIPDSNSQTCSEVTGTCALVQAPRASLRTTHRPSIINLMVFTILTLVTICYKKWQSL